MAASSVLSDSAALASIGTRSAPRAVPSNGRVLPREREAADAGSPRSSSPGGEEEAWVRVEPLLAAAQAAREALRSAAHHAPPTGAEEELTNEARAPEI